MAYENLGDLFCCLGYFRRAIEYHRLHLKIAKEMGEKFVEGRAYGNLGISDRALGNFEEPVECYDC